jgi:dienelactone hydrolase
MAILSKFVCAILMALCTQLCAAAQPQRVGIESASARGNTQTLHAWWFAAGQSNAPVVIAMHGCGGLYGSSGALNARHAAAAELLNETGFAVLLPDSLTDRGLKTLCTTKFEDRALKQADRVQDVAAAVRWIEANTQAKRILLLGWSHGGGVVLAATDSRRALPELARISKAIAFYPGCTAYAQRKDYTPRTPLLILIGADDDWTPAAPCQALDGAGQAPRSVRTVVYPGAVHSFDTPNQPVKRRMDVPNGVAPGAGVLTGGNPQARQAAYAEMLRFFAQD